MSVTVATYSDNQLHLTQYENASDIPWGLHCAILAEGVNPDEHRIALKLGRMTLRATPWVFFIDKEGKLNHANDWYTANSLCEKHVGKLSDY